MEHKSQISIINVTRSFQEGDRADTYRDLVVQGTCFNPDRHRVETITRSELMTPEAVWQKLLKSKLLASSGSNDNVGEPLKGPEADLEPNLESAVVRNLEYGFILGEVREKLVQMAQADIDLQQLFRVSEKNKKELMEMREEFERRFLEEQEKRARLEQELPAKIGQLRTVLRIQARELFK